jgi:hypothetical protein
VIPNLTAGEAASLLQRGFATYGSDSGHQFAPNEWTLSDEALKNLGYMQMKKTHDAAMVLIERTYGERPRYNYFVGTSQGGREALTVALPGRLQRYCGQCTDRQFLFPHACARVDPHPGKAAGQLGDTGED